MKHHLNTLYVTIPNAYLRKDGASVAVSVNREERLRIPLHNLGGIVCFGPIGVSPALMAACANAGVAITYLTQRGKFMARVSGFTPGNVLLRREQYRQADDQAASLALARHFVQAKLANSRTVLLRAARERAEPSVVDELRRAAALMADSIHAAENAGDLDALRGIEGDASRVYFDHFNALIVNPDPAFAMRGRSRRPPTDPTNALLSFLYSMLAQDARTACETVGLDPAVGFLHRDRPGRPSLALDLMEEFRAFLADRVALSLINRQQVTPSGFVIDPAGGVTMSDAVRRTVLTEYQRRKQETIVHPFLGEKTTVGLLPHLQARLLARRLRGELDAYPPLLVR
jgi:CRISPR-associated protein Cas1